MSDLPTPPAAPASSVAFTLDDAVAIANTVGALAAAIVPGEAALIALLTGAAELLRDTILPAIQRSHDRQLSIATQATLAAESAAERARVGAPQAVTT